MAFVTNADDNDKNSILFVSSGMYTPNKYFISVCLAIVWSLRYRLALTDQI